MGCTRPDTYSAAEAKSPSSRTSPAPRQVWTLRFWFSFGTASWSTRLQAAPSSLPRAPRWAPAVPAATSAGAGASFPPPPPPPPLRSPGSPAGTAACSGRYARRSPLSRLSVPSRKSACSATLPEDSVRRGQGRRARATVRLGPPSNLYRYRRSRRSRRLRPVNFPRGRWEFWETRRSAGAAAAPPPPQLRARLRLRDSGPGSQLTGWSHSRPEEQRSIHTSVRGRSRGWKRTSTKMTRLSAGGRREPTQWSSLVPQSFSTRTLRELVTLSETCSGHHLECRRPSWSFLGW